MNCIFCNQPFDKDSPSKVCGECGTDQQKFKDAANEHVELDVFESILQELFFHSGPFEYNSKEINEIRLDHIISYQAGYDIYQQLKNQFLKLHKYLTCTLEFDENLKEAYAGGDTLLRFQFTNNSDEIIKSIEISWDDKLTNDEEDYKVRTTSLVMRNTKVILEGTHVFERPGSKTIGGVANDLIIKIETMRNGILEFKSVPFSFTISNPNSNVFNSVSNNTSINVEAQRVVGTFDASKTGATQNAMDDPSNSHRWKKLKIIPLKNRKDEASEQLNKLSATIPPIENNTESATISKGEIDYANLKASKDLAHSDSFINDLLNKNTPQSHSDATEIFSIALKALSQISPLHHEKSVILALDLSLELIQHITENVQDLSHNDITAILISDPESAFIDAHGYISGFDGTGYIFTTHGVISTTNGSATHDFESFDWLNWSKKGAKPQIRRYSKNQFLIFIGDKTGQSIPGFSFDFRRYNGEAPIEAIYQKMNEAYHWLLDNPLPKTIEEETEEDVEEDFNEISELKSTDDWVSPYTADSVETAIIALFENLELMCVEGEFNAYKTCLSKYLSPNLYKCFAALEATGKPIGVIFNDTDNLVLNNGLVDDFDGLAAVFGDSGFTVVSSTENGLEVEDYTYWFEFNSLNIQFYRYEDGDNFSFAFAQKDGEPIQSTLLDFSGIDCDSTSTCGLSVNTLSSRCWEIIEFISNQTKDGESLNIHEDQFQSTTINEAKEESIDFAQLALETKVKDLGEKFFSLFSYALQQCSELHPKSIYTRDEISDELFVELYNSIGQSGIGPFAISIDSASSTFTNDGKVSSWSDFANLISVEGIFHMTRSADGTYGLDGKNAFLSWNKIFNNFNVRLYVRPEGPDLWFGTEDKILLRNCYCDYSHNIAQWDYFEDFVQGDLLKSFESFRKCYI